MNPIKTYVMFRQTRIDLAARIRPYSVDVSKHNEPRRPARMRRQD
jgi:hypothetical protein